MAQMKRIWTMGQEIIDQARTEYPADDYRQAISDMCILVRDADGLNDAEYSLLLEVCGF
jgi:hypothetical protein